MVLSAADSIQLRDQCERDLQPVFDGAVKEFLALVRAQATKRARSGSLVAAAGDHDPLTLGELAGWWQTIVDARVVQAVHQAWQTAYKQTRGGGRVIQTSQDQAEEYLSKVRDRLVRGIQPPIQEDTFDRIRVSTAQAQAEGWTRNQLARRIAADARWEQDGPYWRSERERYDAQIDDILDKLGPPGTPEREYARLHDPHIRQLQAARSNAVLEAEKEQSVWQTRSQRIARTEATGAANYGAVQALKDEGRTHKQWIATEDKRTRPEHIRADRQIVKVDDEFEVGGYRLHMPGDPGAPARLVINCRCTVIGADDPEPSAEPDPWAVYNVNPQAVEGLDLLTNPDGSPRRDGMQSALANANPYYEPGVPRAGDQALVNCQKCVATYELRRRGIDATASLGNGGEHDHEGIGTWFENFSRADGDYIDLSVSRGGDEVHDEIKATVLANHPEGARGALSVRWTMGSAHILNWEIRDGEVYFVDAQVNKRYGRMNRVWGQVDPGILVWIGRLDDKRLTAAAKRAFLTPAERKQSRFRSDLVK